jgi:hypothetical protein
MATFKSDFTLANTERIRQTTADAVGYHGVNAANAVTPDQQADDNAPDDATAAANAAAAPLFVKNVQGGRLYYCWTHGLSPTASHTSITRNNRDDGHVANATAFSMQGGCAEIWMPENRPPRHNRQRPPARDGRGRGRGADN